MHYVERIQLAIKNRKLSREKRWTESIAMGSPFYVAKIAESLRYKRRRFAIEENDYGSSTVWESCVRYS
jgi:hypothetical protein